MTPDQVRTVEEIIEGLLSCNRREGLTEHMLTEIMQLSNNKNRVKFVYNLLENHGLLPSITIKKKSDVASNSFRMSGNDYWRENKLYEAMQLYNLALLHAPIGSSSMALALGNRSAVLYSMKNYRESLKDIEAVLDMDQEPPEVFLSKLFKRRNLCREELSQRKNNKKTKSSSMKEDYWRKFIKVNYPHNTIPCASSSIEVLSTEEMGRHVVASKDIKVGEVIAIEKPYATTLNQSQYLIRCYHCLALCNNLLPCDYCCFVMFCSNLCKEAAWDECHKIECPLMAALVEMKLSKTAQALRIVIKARNKCNSWKMFIDTIKEIESSQNTLYRGHVKTKDKTHVFDSKYFNSIHSLETNVTRISEKKMYHKSVIAALFLHFLHAMTNFLDYDIERVSKGQMFWETGSLLLHHILSSDTNMHVIESLTKSEDGNPYFDPVEIGCGTYAFLSLFNHSCACNVRRMRQGTEIAIMAIRPVMKGNQLFDNYGFEFTLLPGSERRASLLSRYCFTCTCVACHEDWPLFHNVKPASKLSTYQKNILSRCYFRDIKIMESIIGGDEQAAIDNYPEFCNMAAAFDNTYPCKEIYTYFEGINKCMLLLSETVPPNKLYKWY